MKRILLIALVATVIGAAAQASTASAHPGGIWYQKAFTLAESIEDKYPNVSAARCWPLPVWAWSRYNAHSFVRGTVRWWDHFLCGVYSSYSDSICFTVAHITGQAWNAFNLSTWVEDGCTPWQLRG